MSTKASAKVSFSNSPLRKASVVELLAILAEAKGKIVSTNVASSVDSLTGDLSPLLSASYPPVAELLTLSVDIT